MTEVTIAPTGLDTWVAFDAPANASATERCRVEVIQASLTHLDGIEVISATVNRTGGYQPPKPTWEAPPGVDLPDPPLFSGLPDFCDVLVRHTTPAGHVAEITVWVPLRWNRRFLGLGGAGSRTDPPWFFFSHDRVLLMPGAIRNGFATATTDSGNRDPRYADWPFVGESGELDRELMRDWLYRGTHDMTLVGKAVTEAIHGEAPKYSYFQGCSGGGRQAMAQAQRYPGDYDGLWSANPSINWSRFVPALFWPALVMKEHRNALPPAKLEAFRVAAVEACDGAVDGLRDGIIGAFDSHEFDPALLVGTSTGSGVITEADAEVMRKIWDGPRRTTGERLWAGLRPGSESWGNNAYHHGLCLTREVDGELVPVPFGIGESWLRWATGDPKLDWRTVTFETFEEIFDRGVRELSEVDTDDPDLSGLRDHGAKLILSHGAVDELIFVEGSIDYYRRVVETIGGSEETASFARLFVVEGDVHSNCAGPGPGLTIAGGMAALMNWVENGTAPDSIIAERFDPDAGEVVATRPAYPYPLIPRYQGSGDPNDAANFYPSHI
ncbi:tannase/feruloyl esterase family alpha/beta hydrolase [Lentzea sp. CA-135723]|uniref:tannase/feruloyl esterase family alpha/beta hydrolase n=1 Tax=Lentzea sp. CA-135723 TaxID=3239950 RepID=UPI003D9191BC